MVKRCCAKSCYNSQLTHKIGYFGFPKNETIAKEWAKLAGREDLLEKKLENLTKYFLCSEHFAPADFVNPNVENKALLMLNRNHNHVPIPSKFENNLQENLQSVIQNSEKFIKYTRIEIDHNGEKKKRGVKRKNEEISWTNESETPNLNYIETSTMIPKDEDTIVEEVIVQEEIEYIQEFDDICRLCAKQTNEPIPIFNEFGEFTVEAQCISLMRDTIQHNDGLPQSACSNCLQKLDSCMNIINGFVDNQALFLN